MKFDTRLVASALVMLLVLAVPALAVADDVPSLPPGASLASSGPATGAPGVPTGAVLPSSSKQVMICDQMGMVTAGTYTGGNGNAIAGSVPFGGTYDLQQADDCVFPDIYEVTEVCAGFQTWLGVPPATAVWVQVYADAGGAPAVDPSYETSASPFTSTPFVDPLGWQGQIICVQLAPGFIIPAGTWWWDIQPVSVAGGDDWFWQVRDTITPPAGGDSYFRDGGSHHGSAFGGPYPGGYGFADWTSGAASGSGAGDSGFSVFGTLIPVELQTFTVE